MKGVLQTTLQFSSQEAARMAKESNEVLEWGRAAVDGFYLYGQGAVFLVELPGHISFFPPQMRALERQLRMLEDSREVNEAFLESMEEHLRATRVVTEEHQDALRAYARAVEEAKRNADEAGAAPPPPPPPAPEPPHPPQALSAPEPEASVRVSEHELQERMKLLRDRLVDRQQLFKAREEEQLKLLESTEGALLDAVAKHGDSLTTVQSDEYINLILATGGLGSQSWGGNPSGRKARVLSVPKSAVLEYKAGRIDLDRFRQSVVGYEF
jgi:hypothetical protein